MEILFWILSIIVLILLLYLWYDFKFNVADTQVREFCNIKPISLDTSVPVGNGNMKKKSDFLYDSDTTEKTSASHQSKISSDKSISKPNVKFQEDPDNSLSECQEYVSDESIISLNSVEEY